MSAAACSSATRRSTSCSPGASASGACSPSSPRVADDEHDAMALALGARHRAAGGDRLVVGMGVKQNECVRHARSSLPVTHVRTERRGYCPARTSDVSVRDLDRQASRPSSNDGGQHAFTNRGHVHRARPRRRRVRQRQLDEADGDARPRSRARRPITEVSGADLHKNVPITGVQGVTDDEINVATITSKTNCLGRLLRRATSTASRRTSTT